MTTMTIAYLADHTGVIPVLAGWFAQEWGDLDTQNTVAGFSQRLPERANRERLPICLLGLLDGKRATLMTGHAEQSHPPGGASRR